jgi:hypothetical protein
MDVVLFARSYRNSQSGSALKLPAKPDGHRGSWEAKLCAGVDDSFRDAAAIHMNS